MNVLSDQGSLEKIKDDVLQLVKVKSRFLKTPVTSSYGPPSAASAWGGHPLKAVILAAGTEPGVGQSLNLFSLAFSQLEQILTPCFCYQFTVMIRLFIADYHILSF